MKVLIAFLFSLISTALIKATNYEGIDGTKEAIQHKLEYLQNHTKLLTNDLIEFDYSLEKGFSCRGKEDIKKKEFPFKIPRDYIICAYEIYPYKFEIIEAIENYFGKKYGFSSNDTKAKVSEVSFVYYLMFLNSENKTDIYNRLKSQKMDYYINSHFSKQTEVLKYFSKRITNYPVYEEEDIDLLNKIGIPLEKDALSKEIFNHVKKFFKDKYMRFANDIYIFIDNYKLFKYFYGYVLINSVHTHFSDYERLINGKIVDTFNGMKHKQVMDEISIDGTQRCIIPFVSTCKHIPSKEPFGKDAKNHLIGFKKDLVIMGIDADVKKGEEFGFHFSPRLPMDKFFINFGFVDDVNPLSVQNMAYFFTKDQFTKQKYELCKIIGCFDSTFDEFYDNYQAQNLTVQTHISTQPTSERILNAIRLYVEDSSNFNPKLYSKKLSRGQWISYSNEIRTQSFFRELLIKQLEKSNLTPMGILESIAHTNNYVLNNKEIKSDVLEKYVIREQIMNYAKEANNVVLKNIKIANEKIKSVLKDQFVKLRNGFEENRFEESNFQ